MNHFERELRRPDCPVDRVETFRYALLFTALLGLLAHAFAFLNLHPSGDGLVAYYSDASNDGEQMALGRIMVPLYRHLTGASVSTPWTVGALALLWLGLAVFLVARLLEVREKPVLLMIAGIFVTNRTIISLTGGFFPWLGTNSCSILLSVGAVMCWRLFSREKKWCLLAAGVGLTALSLGFYQSFLPAIITLIMVRSMLDLLQRRGGGEVVVNGLFGMGMILLGGLSYYVMTTTVCRMMGVQMIAGTYNSMEVLWTNDQPILARLVDCYKLIGAKFVLDTASAYSRQVVAGVNTLLTLFSLSASLLLLRRRKVGGLETALFLVLAAGLPMGANFMRMLSGMTHDLMFFAFWLLYLVPLLLARELWKERQTFDWIRILSGVVCLCIGFLIFANIQTANLVYTRKEVQYQSTLSLMTKVMYDVERLEGYVEGETQVAFVGTPHDVLISPPGTETVASMIGITLNSPISYNYRIYFRNVMQRQVNAVTGEWLEEREEVQAMPRYPQRGYAAMIDETAVVRFR